MWILDKMPFLEKAPESKAKVITRLEGYSRTLVSWKNYFISAEDKGNIRVGDIVKDQFDDEDERPEEESFGPLFGNYFLRIPFLEKIHSYKLEWKKNHYRKGQEGKKGVENTEEFEYINLKDQVFASEVQGTTGSPAGEKTTDKSGTSFNRIDVTVEYLVTMRVVNPYKFLFDSPGNSFDEVLDYLDTRISNIISQVEPNLLKRMKGSGKALWYGLGNPDSEKYSDPSEYREEHYPNFDSGEEFDKMLSEQRALWSSYKRDISYSDNVQLLFKGLKNDEFVQEKAKEWGIEIDSKGIEIKTVDEPEIIKKARQEAVEKEVEIDKIKVDRKVAAIEAEKKKIEGQGERDRQYNEMRAVEDLARLFRKYGEANPVESAIMLKRAYMAAEKGNLKEINIKGLEGGSIASIAAQLGIGKELRNIFGKGGSSKKDSNDEIGFKSKKSKEKKDNNEKKDEEKDESKYWYDKETGEKKSFEF